MIMRYAINLITKIAIVECILHYSYDWYLQKQINKLMIKIIDYYWDKGFFQSWIQGLKSNGCKMQTISDLTQNIQGEFVWGTPLLLFVAPFRDLAVGRREQKMLSDRHIIRTLWAKQCQFYDSNSREFMSAKYGCVIAPLSMSQWHITEANLYNSNKICSTLCTLFQYFVS